MLRPEEVYSALRNHDEDVVQEVLLRAVRLGWFDRCRTVNFFAVASRSMRLQLQRRIRALKRRPERLAFQAERLPTLRSSAQQETVAILRQEIERMPDIVWWGLALGPAETARRFAVPEGTVKVRIHRWRKSRRAAQ